jgi:simple sugar transport system ATP-binding protein
MSEREPALELAGVSKRYGDALALDDASLRVERGTIHALVGENGAGKSTLLGIANGEVRADRGTMRVNGVPIALARWKPAAAIASGLGLVHQHFMLIPRLKVVENVMLGREARKGLWLDSARVTAELREAAARAGMSVWPELEVERLGVGEQQRVEILKVLWRGAEVVLLDEPTAVLSPSEVSAFLTGLKSMRAAGRTVVLCTHRLDEVAEVADRVTVMRAGRGVAELPGGTAPDELARAMMGEDALERVLGNRREVSRPAPRPGIGLAVTALHVPRVGGGAAITELSLAVRQGEILAVAGVEGNGQSELGLGVAGLLPAATGAIQIAGVEVSGLGPAARQKAGLGHVPEDRLLRGVVPSFTVAQNVYLGRQQELSRGLFIDQGRTRALTVELLEAWEVRPRDPDALMASLSGGNQQKVVVARELTRPGLRALVLCQPTRGVDLGARALIHQRIREVAARGVAILLVSADLDELLTLADRLLVMARGGVVGELPGDLATRARVGGLMTGAELAP